MVGIRFTLTSCIALAVYVIALWPRCSSEPTGSDASGYLNSARILAHGNLATTLRTIPELPDASVYVFQPLGFQAFEHSTRLVPIYPIGYPAHLAAASALAGWTYGPIALGLAAAVGCIVLCYLICRRLEVSQTIAVLGAASLAVCSAFIYTSIQPFSDTLATFWCSAAFLAALSARSGAKKWAVLCGAALAIAIAVRPTDILILPALAIVLRDKRSLGLAALAAAPIGIALVGHKLAAYGGPLKSDYDHVRGLFALGYFAPTLRHFGEYLLRLLPLSALAIAHPFIVRRGYLSRERAALALWGAAFVGFYSFYYFSHTDWSFVRFIEPTFPALIALACIATDALVSTVREHRRPLARILLVGTIGAAAMAGNLSLRIPNAKKHNRSCVAATDWLARNVPGNAAIVCMFYSGTVYFRSPNPIIRWEYLSNQISASYFARLSKAKIPIYALTDSTEEADLAAKHLAGTWEKMADFNGATAWKITY
jgi:hypothetical protein